MPTTATPWWTPERHADRRAGLLARGRIKAAVRRWFETEGFVEVDTACLQVSPGNETHLHAFHTAFETEAGARRDLYLHTSPELACKKLLAAGETKIFTFAPSFRNGEAGRLHAPEFTMLEWYRVGAPYTQLFADCAAITRVAAETVGRGRWAWEGRTCDVHAPWRAVTVDAALARYAGIDLAATYDAAGTDAGRLRAAVTAAGLRATTDDTWSDLFSRVLSASVEPQLGRGALDMLCAYPASEAALARPITDDPRHAERFEMYCCGVELANGFGELTDAVEQRRRFEADMSEKARLYGRRYPIDEDFLDALAQMPAASGCALGFDRLVMLAVGATRIDQVLWTPVDLGRHE